MPLETTVKYHPGNERLKRVYLRHQREARGKADATIDAMAKAIHRFESYTGHKDLGTFNREQAIAFKAHLLRLKAARSGKPISKATARQTLNALKDFFAWLASQPGYRSRITASEIDYLSLTTKDAREAQATTFRSGPTIEQIRRVIELMPGHTPVERRDRALVAFALVSGMRDKAITTLRLKHIDIDRRLIHQDPREVDTKFAKQIVTAFFPVGDDLIQIVVTWVAFLRGDLLYGLNDPVFPQTRLVNDDNTGFRVDGLKPVPWSNASPIRDIFRKAFDRAGLPYSNPHLFRKTLAELGQRICQTPEQLKAWSQNLGHENVLTTFTSYGQISVDRQAKLIRDLGQPRVEDSAITRADLEEMIRRVAR